MTINEMTEMIIIDLKEDYDQSFLSGKEPYIRKKIEAINATNIRKEFNELGKVDNSYYLDYIYQLKKGTDTINVEGVDIEITNNYYSFVIDPTVPGLKGKEIQYVGSAMFNYPFSYCAFASFFVDAEIFNRHFPKWTRVGNKILVRNLPSLQGGVGVKAIFKSPGTLDNHGYDEDFPCPSDYNLMVLVKQDLLATWGNRTKTANDNLIEQSNVQQGSSGE